ncbi:S-norcoclaurine synthase 2-like [Aristolochia californica]|uniref:S-norcoclaurine synthase 2-like n=1 Tax=Aristolochia californica TaxID=171875 RepID=UPI0035E0C718
MKGHRTHEYVPFPAADVWEVVSTLELPQLVKNMPGVLDDLIVDGDGSVGTLFTLVVPEGWPFRVYRERIATVDHVNRLKDVDVLSGGVLDHGFTFCRTRFEIVDLGPTSSMFRGTILFEINDDQAAEKVEMVALMEMDAVGKAIANYIVEKKSHARKLAGEQSFEMEVPHSAAAVWDVYSTLKLPELLRQLFPDIQWEGDGSVGTIFIITVAPGPLPNLKERVVTLDQQKRIKEVDEIEGGHLEKDFTFYCTRMEIIEKNPKSSIIRSIIQYELNRNSPTASENMKLSNVMGLKAVGDAVSNYLTNQN